MIIGGIYGMFASMLLTLTTNSSETLEMPVVFVFAYLAFINAQELSWSGIMAIIGYGIVTKRYTFQNLSSRSLNATKSGIKVALMSPVFCNF